MLVWPSCPQACITPGCSEAKASPLSSCESGQGGPKEGANTLAATLRDCPSSARAVCRGDEALEHPCPGRNKKRCSLRPQPPSLPGGSIPICSARGPDSQQHASCRPCHHTAAPPAPAVPPPRPPTPPKTTTPPPPTLSPESGGRPCQPSAPPRVRRAPAPPPRRSWPRCGVGCPAHPAWPCKGQARVEDLCARCRCAEARRQGCAVQPASSGVPLQAGQRLEPAAGELCC